MPGMVIKAVDGQGLSTCHLRICIARSDRDCPWGLQHAKTFSSVSLNLCHFPWFCRHFFPSFDVAMVLTHNLTLQADFHRARCLTEVLLTVFHVAFIKG